MRRIAEIARSADVSIETVLRVLHGDPVSEELTNRVTSAIDELAPGNEVATRAEVEDEIEGRGASSSRRSPRPRPSSRHLCPRE